MKTKLVLFIFLVGFLVSANSQDTLYLQTKEQIVVDLIEVGDSEITYRLFHDLEGPIYRLDVVKVDKVVTHSGITHHFSEQLNDPELYAMQKKNALKIGLFNFLLDNTQISYERSLKPGRSLEATLGIIGLGADASDQNARGVYTKLGYKFMGTPNYYLKGMRYGHILNGWYAKPELVFSYYSKNQFDFTDLVEDSRNTVFAFAFLINVGKQWVFSDNVVLDLFLGAGYGYSDQNEFDFQYGFIGGENEVPIALTGGFKVGFLF
jgi:hypothetical protein